MTTEARELGDLLRVACYALNSSPPGGVPEKAKATVRKLSKPWMPVVATSIALNALLVAWLVFDMLRVNQAGHQNSTRFADISLVAFAILMVATSSFSAVGIRRKWSPLAVLVLAVPSILWLGTMAIGGLFILINGPV